MNRFFPREDPAQLGPILYSKIQGTEGINDFPDFKYFPPVLKFMVACLLILWGPVLSGVPVAPGPDLSPPSLHQVALPTPWGSHPPLRGLFQVLWWCQWFLAPCLQPTLSSTTKMLQFFCPHRLSSCRSPAGHKGLCSPDVSLAQTKDCPRARIGVGGGGWGDTQGLSYILFTECWGNWGPEKKGVSLKVIQIRWWRWHWNPDFYTWHPIFPHHMWQLWLRLLDLVFILYIVKQSTLSSFSFLSFSFSPSAPPSWFFPVFSFSQLHLFRFSSHLFPFFPPIPFLFPSNERCRRAAFSHKAGVLYSLRRDIEENQRKRLRYTPLVN